MIASRELYFHFDRELIVNNYIDVILSNTASNYQKRDKDLFRELLSSHEDNVYVIRKSALELSKTLKLDKAIKDEDYSFLFNIKNEKGVYLFGDKFYKYHKTDGSIQLIMMTISNGNYISYDYCHIKEDRLIYPSHNEKFLTELEIFIKLYIFINLSETIVETVSPNQKHGTKKTGLVLNDVYVPLRIVDTTWNKIIKVGSFSVNAHFRLQACGELFAYRKLIYIDGYDKNGYTLNKKGTN